MSEIREQMLEAVSSHRSTGAAQRLCTACVDLLDVDAAAISLVFDGSNAGTLGVSSPPALVYDELQFTVGEGPCLESVASRAPVLVTDLADPIERRWPIYGPAMLAHGIHGVFALPVVVAGEFVGALDLFRTAPNSLSVEELAGGLVAAELAEMPLLDLIAQDRFGGIDDPTSDLWTELNALSRVEVNQATGVLVAQLELTSAEALALLRAHAWASGRSARGVARDILDHRLRLEIDP